MSLASYQWLLVNNMHKIAIILFPGSNCHLESYRAVKQAGLAPEIFRWNDDYQKLKDFDGYFIVGGFSYEDRIRSGAIAGRDPVMSVIKEQADLGKPVLGICNGAQILVESGLIPGLKSGDLGAGLAWNDHGYLNIWVRIKNEAPAGRSAFNNFPADHHFALPIAHGEGRWAVPAEVLAQLQENGQCVFRYCDVAAQVKNEYPVNPNGTMSNLAGVCNPQGNVLALMPHPERTADGQVIFESMRQYLEAGSQKLETGNKSRLRTQALNVQEKVELKKYKKSDKAYEFLVDLIITDNEAETLQVALDNLGYPQVKVSRLTHFEVGVDKKSADLTDELIRSGELLNTNKEIAYVDDRVKLKARAYKILVRYKDDFFGPAKLATLNNRLSLKSVKSVKQGVVWQLECKEDVWQKILASHILFNPYVQEAQLIAAQDR